MFGGRLGTTEIIIIAVLVLVLFGAKKMPEAARSLGRSMRILKAETKGLRDDDKIDDIAPSPAPAPPAQEHVPAPLPPAGTANGTTPARPAEQRDER
ncbi:MAG: Sec-independent protein translocase subunit TatA [Mycobacteriales bacterium]